MTLFKTAESSRILRKGMRDKPSPRMSNLDEAPVMIMVLKLYDGGERKTVKDC